MSDQLNPHLPSSIDVQRYCDTFYKNTTAKTDGHHWFCDKRH
ncbi:hypothetical protein [Nocardia sp. NPDC059239]